MTVPFLDIAEMHAELRADLDAIWRTTVDSSRFIGGPEVEGFEATWSDYCNANYCVGLSSGTAALQLVLTALGIGPGDEVIVPANTFIASAAAVVASGARPVFVDVDPATLLLSADTVRAAITPRTAAVMPVHLYGQPPDMDAIGAIAEAAGLAVIEDAAQAHGATWSGKIAGSMGIAGCFSFYPPHPRPGRCAAADRRAGRSAKTGAQWPRTAARRRSGGHRPGPDSETAVRGPGSRRPGPATAGPAAGGDRCCARAATDGHSWGMRPCSRPRRRQW